MAMLRLFQYSVLLLALLLGACTNSAASTPRPSPRPIPTLRPTLPLPTLSHLQADETETPDTGWILGSNGIELRKLRIDLLDRRASLSIARIDLSQVRLRVGYAPGEPHSLADWAEQSQLLLVVNGGFFDQDFYTTALLISDGVASGSTYEGFGGMLAVAPGGEVTIQPLRDQPYDPAQPLEQAMQSFPMLVFPGGIAPGIEWNSERDRRTALAFDRGGRLLVIVVSSSSFSLNEFADWLRTSDLDLDRALNLDGGSSTGLYIEAGAARENIEPFVRLPIVLIVEPRT